MKLLESELFAGSEPAGASREPSEEPGPRDRTLRPRMRHAVLTPFFGLLRDRFCDYQQPLAIAEKLRWRARCPAWRASK